MRPSFVAPLTHQDQRHGKGTRLTVFLKDVQMACIGHGKLTSPHMQHSLSLTLLIGPPPTSRFLGIPVLDTKDTPHLRKQMTHGIMLLLQEALADHRLCQQERQQQLQPQLTNLLSQPPLASLPAHHQ